MSAAAAAEITTNDMYYYYSYGTYSHRKKIKYGQYMYYKVLQVLPLIMLQW